MGSFCSCWSRHSKGVSLLLVGLENSGKTTALKGLAGEPAEHTIPTIGFSCSVIQTKRCLVKIFDLGGLPNIRGIWDKYFSDVHGVIYVVDASQVDRLEESKAELEKLLSHEKIRGKPLLVLANKQDLPGALDELDLVDRLNLEQLVNLYKCPTTVETCAALLSPDPAIQSGFNWLISTIWKDFTILDSRVSADLATQMVEQTRLREERLARVEELRRERGNPDENAEEQFDASPFRPIEEIMAGSQSGPKMIMVQQSPPPPENPDKDGVTEVKLLSDVKLNSPENTCMLVEAETGKPKKSFFPTKNNKTAPILDTNSVRKKTTVTTLPPIKQKSPVPDPTVPWMKPVLSANGERNGSAEQDGAWEVDQSLDVIQLADAKTRTIENDSGVKSMVTQLHRPKLQNGH